MNTLLLLLVMVSFIVFNIIIRRTLKSSSGSTGELTALVKKFQTEENKDHINGAIYFHNKRVSAGANNTESYTRLLSDIRRIGGVEEDQS